MRLTADTSANVDSFDSLKRHAPKSSSPNTHFYSNIGSPGSHATFSGTADAASAPPSNARVVKPAGRAELNAASHPAGRACMPLAVCHSYGALPTGPEYASHRVFIRGFAAAKVPPPS